MQMHWRGNTQSFKSEYISINKQFWQFSNKHYLCVLYQEILLSPGNQSQWIFPLFKAAQTF